MSKGFNLKQLLSLPEIMPPRKGDLIEIYRSETQLSDIEHQRAQNWFVEYDTEGKDQIYIEELRSLLVHLNIQMKDNVFNEYLETAFQMAKPPTMDFAMFLAFLTLILQNQPQIYRQLYREGSLKECTLDMFLESNWDDKVKVFSKFDSELNNFLKASQIEYMLSEVGHQRAYIKEDGEVDKIKWKSWVDQVFRKFDINGDGFMTFEEFISLHEELIIGV